MITLADVQDAIARADQEIYLPEVPGYTSPKVRRLLNRLGSKSSHYLEVGTHLGSCFIATMYGNRPLVGTVIDNWSLEGDHRPEFESNCLKHIPNAKVQVFAQDCFTVDLQTIKTPPVDLYFYDAAHDRQSQYKAITYFTPVLAEQFVLLVDDCNWAEPREETEHALKDLDYLVEWSTLLPGAYNGDQTGFWNGVYIGLIQKGS